MREITVEEAAHNALNILGTMASGLGVEPHELPLFLTIIINDLEISKQLYEENKALED